PASRANDHPLSRVRVYRRRQPAPQAQGYGGFCVKRRRGIRWHLFQVQLVSMVPIGLFAATLLYLHWQVQEHERQRSQIESVRLLAAAVDNPRARSRGSSTAASTSWRAAPKVTRAVAEFPRPRWSQI